MQANLKAGEVKKYTVVGFTLVPVQDIFLSSTIAASIFKVHRLTCAGLSIVTGHLTLWLPCMIQSINVHGTWSLTSPPGCGPVNQAVGYGFLQSDV